MTKIKTLKNDETGERYAPRTHVKAVYDDNGNTLDSLMGVQDEKLSELGSELVIKNADILSSIGADCVKDSFKIKENLCLADSGGTGGNTGTTANTRLYGRFIWEDISEIEILIPDDWYVSLIYFDSDWQLQESTTWYKGGKISLSGYTHIAVNIKDSSENFHVITPERINELYVIVLNKEAYLPAMPNIIDDTSSIYNFVEQGTLFFYEIPGFVGGYISSSGEEASSDIICRTDDFIKTSKDCLLVTADMNAIKTVVPNAEKIMFNIHCYDTNKVSLGRSEEGEQYLDNTGNTGTSFTLIQSTAFIKFSFSTRDSNNDYISNSYLTSFNAIKAFEVNDAIRLRNSKSSFIPEEENDSFVSSNGLYKLLQNYYTNIDIPNIEAGSILGSGDLSSTTACRTIKEDKIKIPTGIKTIVLRGNISALSSIIDNAAAIYSVVVAYTSEDVNLGRVGTFVDISNKDYFIELPSSAAYIRIVFDVRDAYGNVIQNSYVSGVNSARNEIINLGFTYTVFKDLNKTKNDVAYLQESIVSKSSFPAVLADYSTPCSFDIIQRYINGAYANSQFVEIFNFWDSVGGGLTHDGTLAIVDGNAYVLYTYNENGVDNASSPNAQVRLWRVNISDTTDNEMVIVAKKDDIQGSYTQDGGAGSPNMYNVNGILHIIYSAKVDGAFIEMHTTYDTYTGTFGNFEKITLTDGVHSGVLNNTLLGAMFGTIKSDSTFYQMQMNSTIGVDSGVYYAGLVYGDGDGNALIIKSTDFINWTFVTLVDFDCKAAYELACWCNNGYLYAAKRLPYQPVDTNNPTMQYTNLCPLVKWDIANSKFIAAVGIKNCHSRPSFFEYNGNIYLMTCGDTRNKGQIIKVNTSRLSESIVTMEVDNWVFQYPSVYVYNNKIYMIGTSNSAATSMPLYELKMNHYDNNTIQTKFLQIME